jgi:hypothetical protein
MKHENLIVEFDGWQVSEINAIESAEFRDNIRKENADAGDSLFFITLGRELFVHRVKAWPFSEACTDDNKREFFKSYISKANEILSKAEKEIKEKRKALLGNLLAGATGT